jgi:hypothetical protein
MNQINLTTRFSIAVSIGLAVSVAALIVAAAKAPAQAGCDTLMNVGQEPAAVASACPENTTIRVAEGHHIAHTPIPVKDGVKFTEANPGGERPEIEGRGATRIFDVSGAAGAKIERLNVWGAEGTEAMNCEPGCGSGIMGKLEGPLTLDRVKVHDNPNSAIGTNGAPLTVFGSNIFGDGSPPFTALDKDDANDATSSAGIKHLCGALTSRMSSGSVSGATG